MGIPSGPSRYLYMATAGFSLLLAFGLHQIKTQLKQGRYFLVGSMAVLLASSYVSHKKVESLSFYTSGRNYIANGDTKTGIEQLMRSIRRGRDVIDLKDAYSRLCLIMMASDDAGFEEALKEAMRVFPTDIEFALYGLAIASINGEGASRQLAEEKTDVFKKHSDDKLPKLVAQIYHYIGRRFYKQKNFGKSVLAYRRALEFDSDRPKTRHSCALALAQAENDYANIGSYGVSIDTFMEALRLQPDLGLAHFGLACSYLSVDDKNKAHQHYEILQTLDRDLAKKLSELF